MTKRGTYTPRPGSIVDRCLGHLKTLPPPALVASPVFCELFDIPSQALSDYMDAAMRHGLIKRQKGIRLGKGSPWLWGLGDGTPMTRDQIKAQSRKLPRRGDAMRIKDSTPGSALRRHIRATLDPSLPVVIPDYVKITRGPSWSFDPRYQIDPTTHPAGAGFSAIGIGRNVETGKGWGE